MVLPRTPRGVSSNSKTSSSPSRASARAATSSPYSRPNTKTPTDATSSDSPSGLLGRLASFVSPFRANPNSSAFGREQAQQDGEDEDENTDDEMAAQEEEEVDRIQAMEAGTLSSNTRSKGKQRIGNGGIDSFGEDHPAQRLNERGREVESNQPQSSSLYPQLPDHSASPFQRQGQSVDPSLPNQFQQQPQHGSAFQTPINKANNFNSQITPQRQAEDIEPPSPVSILREFFNQRPSNVPLSFEERQGITELLEQSQGIGAGGINDLGMSRDQIAALGYGFGGLNRRRDQSMELGVEREIGSFDYPRSPSIASRQSEGIPRATLSLNHISSHQRPRRSLNGGYGFDFTPTSNAPKSAFTGTGAPMASEGKINPSRSLNSIPFSFKSSQTLKAQPTVFNSTSSQAKNSSPLPYRRKRPLYLGPGMSGRSALGSFNNHGVQGSTGLIRSQSAGTSLANQRSNPSATNGNESREGQDQGDEDRERDSKRRKNQTDEQNRSEQSNASADFLDLPSDPNAGLPNSKTSPNIFGMGANTKTQTPIKISSKRPRDETDEGEQSLSNQPASVNGSEKKIKSRTASAMLDILSKDQNTSLLSKNNQAGSPGGNRLSSPVTKSNLDPIQSTNPAGGLSTSSDPSTPAKSSPSSVSSLGLRKGRLLATPAAQKERERLKAERERRGKEQEEGRLRAEEELRKTREEEREKIRLRKEREEDERKKQGLLGKIERTYGNARKSIGSPTPEKERDQNLLNNGIHFNQNRPKKPSPLGMITSSSSASSDLSAGGENQSKDSDSDMTAPEPALQKTSEAEKVRVDHAGDQDQNEDEDEGEVEGELGNKSQSEDGEEDERDDEDDEEEEEEEEEEEVDQLAGEYHRDDVGMEDQEPEDQEQNQDRELQGEEEDDDDEVQTPPPPPSFSFNQPNVTTPEKQGSSTTPSLAFSQPQAAPSPAKSVAWSDTPIKSAESKPPTKGATPTTPVSILSKSKSHSNASSTSNPNSNSNILAKGATNGSTASLTNPSTPKEEAKTAPLTSLPSFDFSLPQSSSFDDSDDLEKSIRLEVKEVGLKSLPSFEFLGDTTNLEASAQSADVLEDAKPKQLKPFSFNSTPPSSSTSSTVTASTANSAATSSSQGPESNPGSDDIASNFASSDKGEGEESESTLYETRAKFWFLKDAKWNDLGVGIVRIKKNDENGKKRLLVRHEANKKVTVNFALYAALTCKREKNILMFLGFQDGNPTNMRCKISTENGAEEFKTELEKASSDA